MLSPSGFLQPSLLWLKNATHPEIIPCCDPARERDEDGDNPQAKPKPSRIRCAVRDSVPWSSDVSSVNSDDHKKAEAIQWSNNLNNP